MYGSLDISTSGMVAQRTRMAAIASNIANARTLFDAEGKLNPYRRRVVYFAPGDPSASGPDGTRLGVHVAEIEQDADAIRWAYDPSSPYANAQGYVPHPDINTVREQVDAMEASRAYEANVAAAQTSKQMLSQVLRLLG